MLKSKLNVPNMSFETSISQICGEENLRFINFVKKILVWRPKDRKTAKELLDDPWLYTNYFQNDDIKFSIQNH